MLVKVDKHSIHGALGNCKWDEITPATSWLYIMKYKPFIIDLRLQQLFHQQKKWISPANICKIEKNWVRGFFSRRCPPKDGFLIGNGMTGCTWRMFDGDPNNQFNGGAEPRASIELTVSKITQVSGLEAS